jgi:hypothetical protein
MTTVRTALIAASFVALAGVAQAQSSTTPANNAATSTGTSTSQTEMNRGVPGVDVDVGRNAKGAVDVTADRNTDASNVTGRDNTTSTSGTADTTRTTRAARADRG